jgi:outer membrane protein assembly factor BamB
VRLSRCLRNLRLLRPLRPSAVAISLSLLLTLHLNAQWPEFRGPGGAGIAPSHPPLTWAEGKNVRWKTAIHGRAWSSPVILDTQIWLTTATRDGRELFAMAVDRESGKILFDLRLFHVDQPQDIEPFNSYASPTPVIEPGRVYVTFGSAGTAAIDTKTGKVLWERRDIKCNHFRGPGSSPILFRHLLIMQFDGSDHQFVIALDKNTGKTVWRTERSIDFKDLTPDGKVEYDGDFRKAFSTPVIVTVGKDPVLVSLGSKAAYGYDPLTGKELWRLEERASYSASTRPVAGLGLVFYPTGWTTGQVLAIRPDGHGDVSSTHVVWRVTRGAPLKPSLLLAGDLLVMVSDTGIAQCLEAKTGALVWRARIGETYSASPLLAGGRIYFFSEDGKATVIDAGRTFKVLAENHLDEGFMATPAIDGDALVARTISHLYRIEETSASRQ